MADATPTLASQITQPPARESVIAECVSLIDDEVRAKRGLSGMAVRTAYSTIKAIKRGFVTRVVDALLDDWVGQLEPYYERWTGARTTSFTDYLTARSQDVAEDLLVVTDERAEKTKYNTARKMYKKMRGNARENVAASIPRLGKIIESHLGSTGSDAEPANGDKADTAAG